MEEPTILNKTATQNQSDEAYNGVDIAGEWLVYNEFDYDKFECYHAAWEQGSDESIDD